MSYLREVMDREPSLVKEYAFNIAGTSDNVKLRHDSLPL